jgi:protein-tyrosine phosphatase
MIDVHSHLMPGVDDGARSVDEALAALGRFRAAGVTRLATTPHLDGSLTLDPGRLEARLAELDAAWDRLLAAVGGGEPSITRGTEVRLDTPVPDLGDARIRLGGTSFVLIEFPFLAIPPRSPEALAAIYAQGYIPVVAHPERYDGAGTARHTLDAWRRAGAYLQVNCGSLLGRYGKPAAEVAWRLLERGAVDLLASDNHARGRVHNDECAELLAELGAGAQADLLLRTNPGRILGDELPLPVAPVAARPGFWRRLSQLFG